MYLVVSYEMVNRSEFCVLDRVHRVAVRGVYSDYDQAEDRAASIAQVEECFAEEARGAAVRRFVRDSGDYEVAVLDVPEGEDVSVLAAPVIHDYYAE